MADGGKTTTTKKDEATEPVEPDTVEVDRLLDESEERFGVARHVLVAGLTHAGLSHRVNLAPEDADAAIKGYLAGDVEVDNQEEK